MAVFIGWPGTGSGLLGRGISLTIGEGLHARGNCGFRHNVVSYTIVATFDEPAMHAFVYKSLRQADTYVYLAARDDFARLPTPLRTQLGELRFVLDVALTPERRLALADPAVVRENLVARGFHVQFPPTMADPMTEDWGTDG